jgi:hypothetical protein
LSRSVSSWVQRRVIGVRAIECIYCSGSIS